MEKEKTDKLERILGIYSKLIDGRIVNKLEEAHRYGVNEKSIQRDIDDIRAYFEMEAEETGAIRNVIYDRFNKGYRLECINKKHLDNSEILAICKILLDSRAFTKREMDLMLEKIIACCVPENSQRLVVDLVRNEAFHYIEPRHKTVFIDKMWKIGQAIQSSNYIELVYSKRGNVIVRRKLKPVAIMFSEYYFYLAAFIDDEEVKKNFEVIDDVYPTIYRMDKIHDVRMLNEKFHIPYKDRFEEGEFRKRVQFMYGGKLQKVKFEYRGSDIDAVIDRLPTARIISEEEGCFIVEAETFGKGIDMWFRSQGDMVKIL